MQRICKDHTTSYSLHKNGLYPTTSPLYKIILYTYNFFAKLVILKIFMQMISIKKFPTQESLHQTKSFLYNFVQYTQLIYYENEFSFLPLQNFPIHITPI